MTPREFSACYEPLTAAEMRIVQAICAGYTSYSEIAEATGRKPRTIATHFCAGLIVQNGRVTVTAPILRYMHGWMLGRVREYAQAAGWTVKEISLAAACPPCRLQ